MLIPARNKFRAAFQGKGKHPLRQRDLHDVYHGSSRNDGKTERNPNEPGNASLTAHELKKQKRNGCAGEESYELHERECPEKNHEKGRESQQMTGKYGRVLYIA